MMDDIVC